MTFYRSVDKKDEAYWCDWTNAGSRDSGRGKNYLYAGKHFNLFVLFLL